MATQSSLRALVSFSCLLLGAAARPQAVPLYYSFAGQVVYSTLSDYPLGAEVTYVFRVDRDAPGYTVDGAGNALQMDDYSEGPDNYRDYFLADYIGGSSIPWDNPASGIKESAHYGLDINNYDGIYSSIRGSNADPSGFDLLDIWSTSALFADWTVGMGVLGENFVSNYSAGDPAPNSTYSSSLVLTSIDERNPFETQAVPEPASYALFALGLLGLCLSLRGARPGRP